MVEEPVPPFWKKDRFYALLMAVARYPVIAIIAQSCGASLCNLPGSAIRRPPCASSGDGKRGAGRRDCREKRAAEKQPRPCPAAWIRNSMVNSCVSWQSRSRALLPRDPPVDE
ncbi:hypothetical protein KIF59_06355 [Enterobacter cloacae subsp. cloacae]|nr:hypothetical protein [Enterobacter cloacae subsp. cloacae]